MLNECIHETKEGVNRDKRMLRSDEVYGKHIVLCHPKPWVFRKERARGRQRDQSEDTGVVAPSRCGFGSV